ncbi:MAG: hypothetical protein GY866_39850 [Proteobacteria bacterium]|nr:hypothetical protein [Pseudomonadota bacterium]
MANKIIKNREKLLDISIRKTELLQSVIENIEDVESNEIFIDEIQEVFMELYDEECSILTEKEITTECPGCGFKCAQIHTFCMACGMKLQDEHIRSDI